jgi:hypothetical protein
MYPFWVRRRLAEREDELGVEAVVDPVPAVHQLLHLGWLVQSSKSAKWAVN